MRIAAVELEDLRRFAGRWRVGPFAPGLNVLAAPNETGKSTLLAAIQAAIFLPHRAQADALRPLGGGVPAVRVELADATGHWVIAKRFAGRVGRAEVTTPSGQTQTGDAAEEEIRRLFGVAPESRRREVPRGVWGALWVEQGHSIAPPELDDPAHRTLRSALEAEVGTVTGAAGIARLRTAIAGELASLQSPAGRQTAGRLREAHDHREELERDLAELRQRRRDVEEDLARLAELLEERQQRLEARTWEAFERQLEEARERLKALDSAKERRQAAQRAAEDAARLAEAAARELDQRNRDR
ncbi:AAA family ATPase, partial [Elioraea sp.]|uniref:AAA family ATPase n=1 Tax=Elioraea sp. TaxID=2185103 RepID=UPI003F71270A